MRDAWNITSPSPDAQHVAHFAFSGEIRFGPPYFALSVDAHSFGQRMFGDVHLWSPSSALLAVQEWLTLDYSEGPITALVILDLDLAREASLARTVKGFIVPTAFTGSSIVYRNDYAGQAGTERFQIDIAEITGWNAFA